MLCGAHCALFQSEYVTINFNFSFTYLDAEMTADEAEVNAFFSRYISLASIAMPPIPHSTQPIHIDGLVLVSLWLIFFFSYILIAICTQKQTDKD